MREIKFRGRDDYGNWHYGDLWNSFGNDYVIIENGKTFSVIPETVGQYTGIKDDNGVEIYEGDIVRIDDRRGNNFFDDYFSAISKVIWDNGWYVDGGRIAGVYTALNNEYINVEVIGNIHDTPELLPKNEK